MNNDECLQSTTETDLSSATIAAAEPEEALVKEEEDLALTDDAPASEKARPRLWLALIVHASGHEVLLERDKIADIRRDLCSPDVVQVKAVYRAIKKDFSVETQVVRKLNFE